MYFLSKCVAPASSVWSAALVDRSDAGGSPAVSAMCGQTEWKELRRFPRRFLPNLPTVSVKGLRRRRPLLSVSLLHTKKRLRTDKEQPTNCVCVSGNVPGKNGSGEKRRLNTWLKCALFCAWKRADKDSGSSQLRKGWGRLGVFSIPRTCARDAIARV